MWIDHADGRQQAMRGVRAGVWVAIFGMGVATGAVVRTGVPAARAAQEDRCGADSVAQLRTTLYFGLARPKGSVSELDWQMFLRDEVTTRFPDGLTAWEAEGQWRGKTGDVDHERAKVLLLVHADTPAAQQSVQAVIARYRHLFDQQSVLWETARVCAAS
jgi:Protein of unknown function (DUF3574)